MKAVKVGSWQNEDESITLNGKLAALISLDFYIIEITNK